MNTIRVRNAQFPKEKRKNKILRAMYKLGCRTNVSVTTRQIAKRTRLSVKSVAQTLCRVPWEVDRVGGKGKDAQWRLKNYYAATL